MDSVEEAEEKEEWIELKVECYHTQQILQSLRFRALWISSAIGYVSYGQIRP